MLRRFAALVSLLSCPATAFSAAPTFETDVRPVLKAYCFECHGDDGAPEAGLDLRLRKLIAAGGENGPAISPEKPAESLLLARLRAGEMPPGEKKLPPEEIAKIEAWIAAGAPTAGPEPDSLPAGMHITDEDRAWWAFRPVTRPAVPSASPESRSPIDAFLFAPLAEKGLGFSPLADRITLARRVTFDLTGLPPTPAEIDAFLADDSPDAYDRLVDRLLASPAYAERWARAWLDVAGHADSEGVTAEDPLRAGSYRYRDYVIRSFAADKPFDRFILEQLAGDELLNREPKDLSPEELELLAATGFLRTAPDGSASSGADVKAAAEQVVTDTVRIVSGSLLGLTVGCAQCHNHRYDPIPQADFYRLRAILEPGYDVAHWRRPAERRVSLATAADREKAAEIEAKAAEIDARAGARQAELVERTFEKEVAKLPEAEREPARTGRKTPAAERTPEQKRIYAEHPSLNVDGGSLTLYDPAAAAEVTKIYAEASALRATKPAEDFLRPLTEIPGVVPTTFRYHRGDPAQPKEPIPPGGLTILDDALPMPAPADGLRTSGRRLAFARWLTDPRHPLVPRVIVNRIWMHHFGRGIVGSPADFGRLGERPTHPELLDWLAREFVDGGWSLKHLHRLMVTSTAYRQSSRRSPDGDAADPDNRLLHRANLRRLDAESVRDSILAASGRLSRKAFGPPVPVREDSTGQFIVGKGTRNGDTGEVQTEPIPPGEEFRRSVYVLIRRTQPLGMLETFDGATAEPNCEARVSSTAAPQSLLLMNGDSVLAEADAFARRLRDEAPGDLRAQLALAWRLAFAAHPADRQIDEAAAFVGEQTERLRANAPAPAEGQPAPDSSRQALATFCQALLGSNGFLYVD